MIARIDSRIELNDGVKMPGYGYGVYKAGGPELVAATEHALALDYRYIDTASFYKNEAEVGDAVKNSGISRDQIFIVSKIWPTEFREPVKALDESLRRLGMDYLDGYLLHWPGLDHALRLKTYDALLREKEKGKILSLGVSNFLEEHLQDIHDHFETWPSMNQIEVHPRWSQSGLCGFCQAKGIKIVSWAPLGRGGCLEIPQIVELAKAAGKTPAQIILRWQIQKNLIPIPKSVHEKRIAENANVFDFSLNEEQMAIIDNLELPEQLGRTGKDPRLWPPMA